MMLYRFEVDYTVPGKMGSKNYVTAVAATDAAHARVEAGKFGNVCPICSTDLRSKTDRNRIAAKKKGIRETEKRLEQKRYEMKVKASRSAPICWLVKYEYHV